MGEGALRVQWLGTASHVVSSAQTTVLIDPFVSRPSFGELLLDRLRPKQSEIDKYIPEKVDLIVCGHSHFDHVLDAPMIAKLRGAKLAGSISTCMWARAEGVPESQLIAISPNGGTFGVGDFEVTFVPSHHGRVAFGRVPFPGEVREVPRVPARFWHYRMGGAFGILLRSRGITVYHNGSADLIDAELEGKKADVLLACLAGRKGTERYLPRLVRALSPSLVVPTHHDAFFAPLSEGQRLLPGIDLEGFISEAMRVAPSAGVISPGYRDYIAIPDHAAREAVLEG
ncbi:MAG: MBL fold metallo-hydrolase [Polyangiaceae bacterium]